MWTSGVLQGRLGIESADEEDIDVMDGDSPVNVSGGEELFVEGPEKREESEEFTPTLMEDVETIEEARRETGIVAAGAAGLKVGSSPAKKGSGKKRKTTKKITKIDIDLTSQEMLLVWEIKTVTKEGTEVKEEMVTKTETVKSISSGKGCPNTRKDPCESGNNEYCTPTGDFKVGKKGDRNTKNSSGARMSWYVEFVPERDIGIHNSQYADGTPRSHGCVRVGKGPEADALAKKINRNAPKGTPVHVHGKAPTKRWPLPKERMKSYKGCPMPPEPKPKPKADKKKI